MHTDKGMRMVASGRSRGGSPVGKRRETAAGGGTPARNSGGLAAQNEGGRWGKQRGGLGL